MALGDLDGDGDLDAFVTNDGVDKVWLNLGGAQRGTFGVFLANGQSLGNSFSLGVALGDLDGDGDLDALVAESQPDHDRVWLNQGGAQAGTPGNRPGTFADSGQRLGPGAGQSRDMALGDFDRDGDLDAFAGRDAGNRVYENNGSGMFTDMGLILGTSRTEAVAIGDLDRDADLDVFVANFGEPAQVWLNQTPAPLPVLPEYRITAFAGTGTAGSAGDGGPAIQAQLESPQDLAVDCRGRSPRLCG